MYVKYKDICTFNLFMPVVPKTANLELRYLSNKHNYLVIFEEKCSSAIKELINNSPSNILPINNQFQS